MRSALQRGTSEPYAQRRGRGIMQQLSRDTVAARGRAMRKRQKFTQPKKLTPRADSSEERAKERERMAEALAACQGLSSQGQHGNRQERLTAACRSTRS